MCLSISVSPHSGDLCQGMRFSGNQVFREKTWQFLYVRGVDFLSSRTRNSALDVFSDGFLVWHRLREVPFLGFKNCTA